MTVTPPDWATTVSKDIIPPGLSLIGGPAVPPMTPQQFAATFTLFTDFFVGEIAIAFGGISVLGWHPFDFLVTWGEDLQAQALAAYLGQQTANTNIGTLIDGLLGTGHTMTDVVAFIQGVESDVGDAAAKLAALIAGVVGSIENTFPLVLPFQFDAPSTVDDLAAFLNTLATAGEVQELRDLLYNTVAGNSGINYVADVSKATLAAALRDFHGVASSATSVAQQALANAADTAAGIEDAIEDAIADIPVERLTGVIRAELLPDIDLSMSSGMRTILTDLVANFTGQQNLHPLALSHTDLANAVATAASTLTTAATNASTAATNFVNLFAATAQADIAALAAWLNTASSNASTAATNFANLIIGVLGAVENVFPLTLPFTFDAPPGADQLADYVNSLVTQQEVQELRDLLYNATLGNTGLAYVQGVAKADLSAALHQLQGVASSATDVAQQALANAADIADNIEGSIQAVIAQGIDALHLPPIPAELLPDIKLEMSSAMRTLTTDLVANFTGQQNVGAVTPTDLANAVATAASTLTTAATNASTAYGNFVTLFVATAQADITALSAWLTTASSNASTAAGQIVSLLAGLAQADVNHLITYLSTASSNASTAATNFANLLVATAQADIAALAAWLSAASSNASTAATNFNTLLTDALGAVENVFPLTLPFTFDAPPGADQLGNYVKSLVTQQELQELRDLLYNATLGNKGINYVVGVAKADLSAAVHQLHGVASSASDIAQQALAGATNVAGNIESNVQAVIAQGIDAAHLPAIPKTLLPDIELDMSSGLRTLHDDIVNNLRGLQFPGINFTPTDSAGALAGAASALTSHAANIAAIQGELNSSGGGINVTVPISGGVLPSSFTDMSSFSSSPLSCNFAQYNASAATSDSQSVTLISSDGSASVCIIRANSDFSSFVWMVTSQLGGSIRYTIGCVVAGVATTLNSAATVTGTQAGNTLTFLCDNAYNFTFELNGTAVHTYSDVSHTSQLGALYRYAGFGTAPGTPLPGAMTQWSFSSTAPTVGSSFRQYRAGTGSSGAITAGSQLLPNSFFDTNDYITSDFTSAPGTNNQLTIDIAGTYNVNIVLLAGTVSNSAGPALFHNGNAKVGNSVGSGAIQTGVSYGSHFLVYCAAGDTLQPGVWSAGSSNTYVGEATGERCYWEVALANCGTIS